MLHFCKYVEIFYIYDNMNNKYIRDVKSTQKFGGEFEQSGDGEVTMGSLLTVRGMHESESIE
jgi:hypothetical protein